ncbi:HvfC family RiPP maturation protein [Lysobacter brunescens]|uniref:DUF2063 domain-containing protein n=1 Tax=Lysobacter brunescens TaxID=262323 RepID=A0ABW2YCC3_9GAMM
MPPESAAQPVTDTLAAQQDALAAHIRDPDRVPPPPGIEERRLKIYRDLFFNNVESLLAGNFPVLRRIHGDAGWRMLIRDFYRDHDCQTPLFTELAREFMRYLEARADTDAGHDDPPWQRELAHYEWVELALQISEARVEDAAHDPDGDLLAGAPVVSPLAWPLAYAWPVHRIGPEYQPETPPEAPTLLMLRREPDGNVSFHALTPLVFRLLQRLEELPALSGEAQLRALAAEAGTPDVDAFLAEGAGMLATLRAEGTLLGTAT